MRSYTTLWNIGFHKIFMLKEWVKQTATWDLVAQEKAYKDICLVVN